MAVINKEKKFETMSNPFNFTPRDYQLEALDAFHSGVRNLELIWHRRAGKDKVCVAMNARAMIPEGNDPIGRIGGYYYVFPEFNQGRKALWDNLDNEGFRTLKHIPESLWASENAQQMKLTLKNGSYLQVVGSNEVDSIVGSNPLGLTFSEWSLQDPKVLGYLNPIINANGGFKIFNYTPRGNNHAKKFHEDAIEDESFYTSLLTVENTGLFTKEKLEEIKADYIKRYGDEGLFLQEYFCSFETPPQGAYYSTQISLAREEGRITKIGYNRDLFVYTAWDLGGSDTTSIIFYQKPKGRINIIDHYETYGMGMEHFRDLLNSKGYQYATHYLPHDADNKLQSISSTIETRADMLRKFIDQGALGGHIQIVDKSQNTGVLDGMAKVRSLFHIMYFDEGKCERLIECIKNYRTEWSEKNMIWKTMPIHDWASHSADALRYLAVSYEKEKILDDSGYMRYTVPLNTVTGF